MVDYENTRVPTQICGCAGSDSENSGKQKNSHIWYSWDDSQVDLPYTEDRLIMAISGPKYGGQAIEYTGRFGIVANGCIASWTFNAN